MCYNTFNAQKADQAERRGAKQSRNGGSPEREVCVMSYVTYSDLFLFVNTIIGIINVIAVLIVLFKINKKR